MILSAPAWLLGGLPARSRNWTRGGLADTIRESMHERVSFRAITEDDISFLRRLYCTTRDYEMVHAPWSEEEKHAFLEQQFAFQHDYYSKHFPEASFELILLDGEPVGRLYLEHRRDEIRLIDIALLPEFRNRGIGGMLMGEVLEQGREKGLPVRIHVEQNNPALRLYQRLGFERVGDVGIYYLMEWSPGQEALR